MSYTSWSAPSLSWISPTTGTVRAKDIGRISVSVRIGNTGTRLSSRPLLLFAQRLEEATGTIADNADDVLTTIVWPNKWLVAFGKAMAVKPGGESALTLSFGEDEMSRWIGKPTATAAATANAGGFSVVPGRDLLTAIDQRGNSVPGGLTLSVV